MQIIYYKKFNYNIHKKNICWNEIHNFVPFKKIVFLIKIEQGSCSQIMFYEYYLVTSW